MGVLESAPHRGVQVRRVTILETIQAFEVRGTLESLAVRSATARFDGQCVEINASAHEIVAAARRHDFGAFQHHNQVFHRAIVRASGNAVLLKVWESLGFEIRTRMTMDYLNTVDPVKIAMEHLPIAEAIGEGQMERAACLLVSHSNGLVHYLKTQMQME